MKYGSDKGEERIPSVLYLFFRDLYPLFNIGWGWE